MSRFSIAVSTTTLIACAVGCTAGEEVIPPAADGGSSGFSGTASGGSDPLGGTAGSTSPSGGSAGVGVTGGSAGAGPSGGTAGSTGGSAGAGPSGGSAGATGGSAGAGPSGGSAGMTGGSAGMAGGSGSGGAGGMSGGAGNGGMSGMGGMGGTPPAPPNFNNGAPFRFEMPCLYENDGSPLSACSAGEVCWVAANDTPANPHKRTVTVPMGGDPGVVYRIRVRIRGVIEPKNYSNCQAMFMRSQTPAGETRQIYVCKAAQNTAWTDTYNVWRFTITDPPQVFYMNADTQAPTHRVNTIDGEFDFDVRGGSRIEMYFDDLNGGQIRNCSLVVPNISPAPRFFDGNFLQLDVVNWAVAP